MFENLQKQSKYIEFYGPSEIPLNKECILLGDEKSNEIEQQWTEYLSPNCDYDKWDHPIEIMDYMHCHISSINKTYLNITLLDRSSRFHSISKVLPINFIKTAFKVFTSEKKPYIIVDQNWFNYLRNSIYSSYVLIDFVGIRNLLNQFGEFPSDKLNCIKAIVDKFCIQNKDLILLTCADNIIIKSAWSFGSNSSKYEPEKLISKVNQLMIQIKKETQITSYAIMTQGANYVNEKHLDLSQTPDNHLFISSISVPFIEAFEIDSDVRMRIKNEETGKMPFYIEQSFYISTNRKYYNLKEPEWFKLLEFFSNKLQTKLSYSALTFENIRKLIKMQ